MGFIAPVSPGRACRDDKFCPFFLSLRLYLQPLHLLPNYAPGYVQAALSRR